MSTCGNRAKAARHRERQRELEIAFATDLDEAHSESLPH